MNWVENNQNEEMEALSNNSKMAVWLMLFFLLLFVISFSFACYYKGKYEGLRESRACEGKCAVVRVNPL